MSLQLVAARFPRVEGGADPRLRLYYRVIQARVGPRARFDCCLDSLALPSGMILGNPMVHP